jgi:hypothetical protein
MVRSKIEQTAVYSVLLGILAMVVLFGIAAAEKGINSLTGTDDPQALAVQSPKKGEVELKVLGKNVSTTQLPWSDQLSDNLEGKESTAAGLMDGASMRLGDWMQAGAQKVLGSLNEWFNQ